jgi:hypothetical protein
MWELLFQPLELFWNASLMSEKEMKSVTILVSWKKKNYHFHITIPNQISEVTVNLTYALQKSLINLYLLIN